MNEHRPEECQDNPQREASDTPPRAPRTPEQWQDLIGQRIEEAMRKGEFDNLRGKGKPLDPAPEPHVAPDMQMANSLLRNNDLVPAWIADRTALLAAIERLRARLQQQVAAWQEAMQTATSPHQRAQLEQQWAAQVATWRTEVAAINKRIDLQNLQQPVTFLEILKLRLEDELRRAGAP